MNAGELLAGLAIMGATGIRQSLKNDDPSTTTPATTNQVQPAKPQMIKKRVCEQVDRILFVGNCKICKTVEVPAEQPNKNGTDRRQRAPRRARRQLIARGGL